MEVFPKLTEIFWDSFWVNTTKNPACGRTLNLPKGVDNSLDPPPTKKIDIFVAVLFVVVLFVVVVFDMV